MSASPSHTPKRSRPGLLAGLSILAIAALPVLAHAQDTGDPVAGKKLAEAWCANCHVPHGARAGAANGAPTFAAVAANRDLSALALRVFLRTPHERMPDLHLSNNETDDLIAYILSPRGR